MAPNILDRYPVAGTISDRFGCVDSSFTSAVVTVSNRCRSADFHPDLKG